MTSRGLEIHTWDKIGYQPLVFSAGWQVALLNWESIFDLDKVAEVERHNLTNEVFVLIRGSALLFTIDDWGMQIEDMKPGVIYNVHAGVWHNLTSTRDASWIIIENRDTHLQDCEYRKLSFAELDQLMRNLPAWIN